MLTGKEENIKQCKKLLNEMFKDDKRIFEIDDVETGIDADIDKNQ